MKYLVYCCLMFVLDFILKGSKYVLENKVVEYLIFYVSNEFFLDIVEFFFLDGMIVVI